MGPWVMGGVPFCAAPDGGRAQRLRFSDRRGVFYAARRAWAVEVNWLKRWLY